MCIHTHTHTHVYTDMHTCIQTHTDVYRYKHTEMYTDTYTHTYIKILKENAHPHMQTNCYKPSVASLSPFNLKIVYVSQSMGSLVFFH